MSIIIDSTSDSSVAKWDRTPRTQRYRIYVFAAETPHKHATFPLDMLRYDRAWPRSEPDSHKMDDDLERYNPPGENRRVELCSLDRPNEDRWRSFGWTVKRIAVKDAE